MRQKRRAVNQTIVLSMTCGCGHEQTIERYATVWRISEAWESDAGTGYPTELQLVCPNCESVLDVMG